jgi:hypothetical protein
MHNYYKTVINFMPPKKETKKDIAMLHESQAYRSMPLIILHNGGTKKLWTHTKKGKYNGTEF